MSLRREFIGFTGAAQILLTLVLLSATSQLTDVGVALALQDQYTSVNLSLGNALGVPLWGAIVIMLCGAGNIVSALSDSKKRRRSNDYFLPASCGTLIANLFAFIVSAVIIGIVSWLLYGVYSIFAIAYSTVIICASLIFILSLIALFVDCFSFCLSGGPPAARPYAVNDYDNGPPRYPSMVYKA